MKYELAAIELTVQAAFDGQAAPEPRHLEEPRGRWIGQAGVLARPRTTAEVAVVIRACAEARVGVVPVSGGTGLVGGQVMASGPAPVLLSLERMVALRGLWPEENALVVEAGMVLADVQAHAAGGGRLFPLSLASEGSCRIGGNLATNAGGRVLAHDELAFCRQMNITPDEASLVLGLERGDIQMLPFVTQPTDLKRLKADPKIDLTAKGYDGIGAMNWLAFNLTRKPLSDIQVRKAIATAIDKKFITKALMGGFATEANGPIVAGSPLASKDLTLYPFDLKKAAAILDAAGYKANADGERFKLNIDYLPNADDQQRNVAEYLRGQLKKVGITVEVRASADFPSWAKRMASKDFDMGMDLVFNWGDPIIGVHRTYLSTNIKPIVWTNTQSYNNPKVDDLLNTAGGLLDPTKRKAYYATFEKIVTDELPIVFINQVPYHTASSKKLANVPTTIWGPLSPYDEVYFK